jgi:hypothetical protein
MLLVFAASALGLLEFTLVWVPPTYFWAGVLGGFILGLGFIVGGYCPGTSLVSMATLKIDGLMFVLGVLFGLFAFGLFVPGFWSFFNFAGAAGRLTLADWLGIDAGWIVLAVVVMAVGAFRFAEAVERLFDPARRAKRPSPRAVFLRRAAVVVALAVAAGTALLGQPTIQRRMAWERARLEADLASRKFHIDPAELLGLMHNTQVQLVLLDVRDEADFNLFHLVDARNVTLGQLEGDWPSRLPPKAVCVVMSNDERAAEEAWKRLTVRPTKINAYVLAGGLNRWLDLYQDHLAGVPGPEIPGAGGDLPRHRFSAALGEQMPAARPKLEEAPLRPFVTKVKALGPIRKASGGCGG